MLVCLDIMPTIVESGVQLLGRLMKRPDIDKLDPTLFYNGLSGNDMVLLSGESSSGKSLLIFTLIAKCVMPVTVGGRQARVILISTDNNNSLPLLAMILRYYIAQKGSYVLVS